MGPTRQQALGSKNPGPCILWTHMSPLPPKHRSPGLHPLLNPDIAPWSLRPDVHAGPQGSQALSSLHPLNRNPNWRRGGGGWEEGPERLDCPPPHDSSFNPFGLQNQEAGAGAEPVFSATRPRETRGVGIRVHHSNGRAGALPPHGICFPGNGPSTQESLEGSGARGRCPSGF